MEALDAKLTCASLGWAMHFDQMRSERIIRHQFQSLRMRASLRAWRFRAVWRVVWQRVSLRLRRSVYSAWRHGKDAAIANRRVARKGHEVKQVKLSSQAWRGWELRLRERHGTKRCTAAAVCAALQRSSRRLLFGALLKWRGRANQALIDRRIDTLTMAVESYEQALKDVGKDDYVLNVSRACGCVVFCVLRQKKSMRLLEWRSLPEKRAKKMGKSGTRAEKSLATNPVALEIMYRLSVHTYVFPSSDPRGSCVDVALDPKC